MDIICSCGHKEVFNRTDDLKTIRQAGFITYGFSINHNSYNFLCHECAKKLSDGIKKILNIN